MIFNKLFLRVLYYRDCENTMKTPAVMSSSCGFLLIELLVALCMVTIISAVFAHSIWYIQHGYAQASWYNKALVTTRNYVENHYSQHGADSGSKTVDGITLAWTTVRIPSARSAALPRTPRCSCVQVTATLICADKPYSLTLLGHTHEQT